MDKLKTRVKRYIEDLPGFRYYVNIPEKEEQEYWFEGLKQTIKVFIDVITHEKSIVSADFILNDNFNLGYLPCGNAYRYGAEFNTCNIFDISLYDMLMALNKSANQCYSEILGARHGVLENNSLRIDFCESKINDNEDLKTFVKWLKNLSPDAKWQRLPDGTKCEYHQVSFNYFKEHIKMSNIEEARKNYCAKFCKGYQETGGLCFADGCCAKFRNYLDTNYD